MAVKQVDTQTMFAIWHLYLGGITEPVAIGRIIGKNIHGSSIKRIVGEVEDLVHGPHYLKEPIRCKECGNAINVIPCRMCGSPIFVGNGYKELPSTAS